MYKKRKLFSNRAFTLLEMLVVLGIIAIMIGLGTASYSTVQRKARDAKRKGDMDKIQKSLEQYYSICGFSYPTSIASGVSCANPSAVIMSTAPTDPKSGVNYIYTLTGSTYTLCAPNSPPLETESAATYCLTNQQ